MPQCNELALTLLSLLPPQLENERLRHEILQWQREVEHARNEKLELEASFRRLDQEIGNGYHLAERKEKELRIAELVMKNQKVWPGRICVDTQSSKRDTNKPFMICLT